VTDPRQKVVFHTLRHTFASWLVETGTDLYVVQKLMGHASFEMVQRYSHLGENALQAAVRRLDSPTEPQKAEVVELQAEGGE
jgi:site-specific recombinase XerD